jgi:hypothetical protein
MFKARITHFIFIFILAYLSGCKDTEFEIINEGSSEGGATLVATVSGKVTDAQGEPVSGVSVVTLPFGRDVELDDIGRKLITDIITNAQGEYEILNLPQGTYKLNFLASGFIKTSLTIGSVDFVPANLIEGQIKKAAVLQDFPIQNDGDMPAVALFDPEDKKRITEILTSHGIRYTSIRGDMAALDKADYNLLVIGLDATVFQDITQLITNKSIIDQFLADGGSIYLGQLNDFSVEATPMPFLTGDQRFALHTENAPFNDFISGTILDSSHPLVFEVSFSNWSFVEAGQQATKHNVTFDAALKSSIESSPNWHIVVTTPSEDFTSGSGTVAAESDVIIAEYIDPRSGSKIVLNQAAFYQGTFGDMTEPNAIKLTRNVVNYIKYLNTL